MLLAGRNVFVTASISSAVQLFWPLLTSFEPCNCRFCPKYPNSEGSLSGREFGFWSYIVLHFVVKLLFISIWSIILFLASFNNPWF